jgi:hypothetical protein
VTFWAIAVTIPTTAFEVSNILNSSISEIPKDMLYNISEKRDDFKEKY